jgi:hypothetical protein
MNTLTNNTEMDTAQLATTAQDAAKPKQGPIEAYGVKGLKNRGWRKTFANAEKLLAWCETNDAIVLGTRRG